MCLSGISQERLAQLYFTAGFQEDLQLAPWRQAQLEPPTSPRQDAEYAGTQHPPCTPGGNVHLGLLNCLFPGISQDRSRTWAHTGRQYESHTLQLSPQKGWVGHRLGTSSPDPKRGGYVANRTRGQPVGGRPVLEPCLALLA